MFGMCVWGLYVHVCMCVWCVCGVFVLCVCLYVCMYVDMCFFT